MANLDSLFEIPKGSSIRQREIEERYLAQGIDLEPTFYVAHKKTLNNTTPVTHRGKSFMSQTMNGNLIGTMIETYSKRMRVDSHGRNYFHLDDQTRIYFKKLDNSYCPRNIPTDHVKKLNRGELLLGDTPITVLYAGFRLEDGKIWDKITGCYLVEMKDVHRTQWISDLSDLAAQMGVNAGTIVPVAPVTPVDLDRDIQVKPKTKGSGDQANNLNNAV